MSRKTITPRRQVLIVKPHNVENQVDERCCKWIMKAFQRGIAEYLSIPAKMPELARNWAINEFLTSEKQAKKTHIFFLDADTVPYNDYAIERLMSHDKPVIAGITPIVRVGDEIKCQWNVVLDSKQKDKLLGIDELPNKPFKVDRVGGTTMLVRRDVLEKLKKPYQISHFNSDCTNIDFSEDYYFCDKVRELGFDIWIDPDVVCHHYHNFDLLDIFSIYEQSVKRKGQKIA